MPMLQMPSSRSKDGRLAAFPVAAGSGGVFGLPAGLGGEDFHQFLAFDDLLDASHHVLRLERLAVVFADEAVTSNAGLGTEMPGKLAAFVVLDNDNPFALAQNIHRLLGLEGNQNPELQVVGRDAFLVESFGGF